MKTKSKIPFFNVKKKEKQGKWLIRQGYADECQKNFHKEVIRKTGLSPLLRQA